MDNKILAIFGWINERVSAKSAESRERMSNNKHKIPKPSYHYDGLLSQAIGLYGKRLGTFLANRISKEIRKCGDLCIDNVRIADMGDPSSVRAYDEQRKRGCCGFWDTTVEFKSDDAPSRFYKIGFNYGH